jgi:hypothetical protein
MFPFVRSSGSVPSTGHRRHLTRVRPRGSGDIYRRERLCSNSHEPPSEKLDASQPSSSGVNQTGGIPGTLDTTFGDGGATYINVAAEVARDFDMIVSSDGLTIAVGQAGTDNNNPDQIAIGRFNTDGTPDTTFGSGGITNTTWPEGTLKTTSVVQVAGGHLVVSATGTLGTGQQRFVLSAYRC